MSRDGKWLCFKCGETGLLAEDRPVKAPWTPKDRRSRLRDATARIEAIARVKTPKPRASEPAPDPTEGGYDFETEVKAVRSLGGTEGGAYLESRGIPQDLAQSFGVRFSPTFGCGRWWPTDDEPGRRWAKGRPAVVFPLRDSQGAVSGVHGRASSSDGYLFKNREEKPVNKQTRKLDPDGSAGVFSVPLDALTTAQAVAVVEAPIDALSLSLCGLATVATVGTGCPEWLVGRLALKVVFLAHDHDEPDPRGVRAGDAAAERIAAELRAIGIRPIRLRPPAGSKDWNDALRRFGREALTAAVSETVAPYIRPDLKTIPPPSGINTEQNVEEVPVSCPQDGPESASNPICHQEHASPVKEATERRVKPRHVKARQWPKIATPEYWALSLGDRRECCTQYDTQWGWELHQLLNYLAAGYESKAERLADEKRVDELVSLIEKAKAAEG